MGSNGKEIEGILKNCKILDKWKIFLLWLGFLQKPPQTLNW